jgi:hypothetical protein
MIKKKFKISQITLNDMNYFGFWSSFYRLLDPDPHSESGSGSRGKFNADPDPDPKHCQLGNNVKLLCRQCRPAQIHYFWAIGIRCCNLLRILIFPLF